MSLKRRVTVFEPRSVRGVAPESYDDGSIETDSLASKRPSFLQYLFKEREA